MLEFDHLFILTQPQAPEVEAVIAKGFSEGSRNIHPGQGTANRRIFFHNAMVEFLWVDDPAAMQLLQAAGIANFSYGEAPLLAVTFDHGRQNQSADFRPQLPLLLQY